MTITPYALMMDDPTTESMICWIDERSGNSEAPQTLRYGPGNLEVQSTVVTLPGGSVRHHHAHITGLEPGTICDLSLPGEGVTFPPVKILPDRVPAEGIVGLSISDMHCGRRTIDTPAKFEFVGQERPDFIIMAGDSSGAMNISKGETSTSVHVATFRDYFTQWWEEGDFLPQMLCDAGNHWVGNSRGDGVNIPNPYGSTQFDPYPNYFGWFHPSALLISPTVDPIDPEIVCIHQSAKIGNWLQVLSGDVYGNFVSSVAEMINSEHDPDSGLCIFMAHSPLISQGDRTAGDPPMQENMRNAIFYDLAQRENIQFTFAGNVHLDTITKPLAWYAEDDDPGHPSIQLAGENAGWLAPAAPGKWQNFIEFGEGCLGGRSLLTDPVAPAELWDRFERQPLNYYIMRFSPGRVVVENKNENGLAETREFVFPLFENASGRLIKAYAKSGAPVRIKSAPGAS